MAAPLGRGLRGLRRRREAVVAGREGVQWMPSPGWAERGGYDASGPGNSVPRFHLTWGTGPGVLEPFVRRVREAEARGLVTFRFRHRVDELVTSGDAVEGVRGTVLEPSPVARGEPSSREATDDFELSASAVLVTSRRDRCQPRMVRRNWPSRLGTAPEHMISGVPDSPTDGCSPSRRTPAGASSTGTGCGTTRRASRTGTRSGAAMGSGSSRALRRCGSTPPASGCPCRSSPASTRWTLAHIMTRATTTPGSC